MLGRRRYLPVLDGNTNDTMVGLQQKQVSCPYATEEMFVLCVLTDIRVIESL